LKAQAGFAWRNARISKCPSDKSMVELHPWRDPRRKPPVTCSKRLSFRFSADNPDQRWLQDRTQFDW
jgi:hypothetical protein